MVERYGAQPVKENHRRLRDALTVMKAFMVQSGASGKVTAAVGMAAAVLSMQELIGVTSQTSMEMTDADGDRGLVMLTDLSKLLTMTLREASAAVVRLKWKEICSVLNDMLQLRYSDEPSCRTYCASSSAVLALLDGQSWTAPQVRYSILHAFAFL